MKEKNPFTLSFGRIPNEYIVRTAEEDTIIDMFTEMPVTDQMYMLLGVRGNGKTVTMTNVTRRIGELDDWITIKISPVDNILDALYRILARHKKVHQLYIDAKLNISVPGINISVSQKLPEQNTVQAIDDILNELSAHNIKVLVTIDEVTATEQMKAFASALQLLITNNRLIFFLGTALVEKFAELRDVENLTFLYRAPKIVLTPLDKYAMAAIYKRVFDYSKEQALKMALITKGYSLAFQVLGYVQWEHRDEFLSDDVLEEFDSRIADGSYSKQWSELSETDRMVMKGIAKSKNNTVKSIRETIGMDKNKFNQYRIRLSERGLIDTSRRGIIEFALPRFAKFVSMVELEENL